ncbi:MAG: hypothetical protein KDI92_14925 [Xanthomonadales bacterium]|nr:hypothetical protein [Xanthomonadales bacterium]
MKKLVLTVLLLVSVKLWAQDEIFVSGFEPVPELFLDASPETILPSWTVIDANSCNCTTIDLQKISDCIYLSGFECK